MRAALNSGKPAGGNRSAFLPRLRFVVESMRITGKGRTWHLVDAPHDNCELANQAADRVRHRDCLTVRVRPVIL